MQVKEKDIENLKKLPTWVKCIRCGNPPLGDDWLVEIVRHSNSLIHQSCLLKLGKRPGIDKLGG